MVGREKSDNVAALEQSLNSSAERVSTIWVSFIIFALYLVIAAGTTTHRQLLVEEPVKLPVLNIDLPLLGFFVLAPALFVIFHAYVMLQVLLLGRTAAAYNFVVDRSVPNPRSNASMRQQLTNTLFAQIFAGSPRERQGLLGHLLRLMAWVTLAIMPVLVLLVFEYKFLPYHSYLVTWVHRVLILLELVTVYLLWTLIIDPQRDFDWRRVAPWMTILASIILFFVISVCLLSFPGEAQSRGLAEILLGHSSHPYSDCQRWFPPSFDGWIPRYFDRLNVARVIVADGEKLSKIAEMAKQRSLPPYKSERTKDFQDRDFSCGNFESADLRYAGFTDARLFNVNLNGAALEGADFARSDLTDADLSQTRSQSANFMKAILKNVSFAKAQLQGAVLDQSEISQVDFSDSQLSGATLRDTTLNGVVLSNVNFTDADLTNATIVDAGAPLGGFYYYSAPPNFRRAILTKIIYHTKVRLSRAHFEGAILDGAQLQGDDLGEADLRGASLVDAGLQRTDLSGADLRGATLTRASLEEANLQYAKLVATDLGHASLQGAALKNADLQAADFNGAELEGADVEGVKLTNAKMHSVYLFGTSRAVCATAWIKNPNFDPIVGFRPYNEDEMGQRLEEACESLGDDCRLHLSSLSRPAKAVPLQASDEGIAEFVKLAPGGLDVDSLRERLRLNPSGEVAWRKCAGAVESQHADSQNERKLIAALSSAACTPSADEPYIANGVYRNWLTREPGEADRLSESSARILSRHLLGLDGQPCAGASNLNPKAREDILRISTPSDPN